MADVQHASLTDPYLHEPKGAASANAGEVYVADGAGSGDWSARQYTVNALIADVSSSETVYVPIPYSGTVVKVVSVLEGAITVADATVIVSNSSAASMGTLTIAYTSSAAGDVDTLVPASNNTVTDNDYITIATDGGSTDAQKLWLTIVVERDN
jgi:hypothetical protein